MLGKHHQNPRDTSVPGQAGAVMSESWTEEEGWGGNADNMADDVCQDVEGVSGSVGMASSRDGACSTRAEGCAGRSVECSVEQVCAAVDVVILSDDEGDAGSNGTTDEQRSSVLEGNVRRHGLGRNRPEGEVYRSRDHSRRFSVIDLVESPEGSRRCSVVDVTPNRRYSVVDLTGKPDRRYSIVDLMSPDSDTGSISRTLTAVGAMVA